MHFYLHVNILKMIYFLTFLPTLKNNYRFLFSPNPFRGCMITRLVRALTRRVLLDDFQWLE